MAEAARKLVAILSADVVGYSKLMGDDERATVRTLTEYREVFRDHIERHRGRVVDAPGDNLLAEFASPVEALSAAVDIQHELARHNRQLAEHRQMRFRIGLNLGDVIAQDDGTLYGDGVNIAARLEGMAEPGGICMSETVYLQVEGKVEAQFKDIGAHEVKNIAKPVRIYRVVLDASRLAAKRSAGVRTLPAVIVATGAVVVLVIIGVAIWQYTQAPEQAAIGDDPVLALPTGPSIAVLPFDNLSGDPEQEYFADGLTGEITAKLTSFRELFVMGRSTTLKFKGQAVDIKEIGRELGIDYVVEGSVRRDVNAIRVTVQLLDTDNGVALWSETYERDLTAISIFALQDDITENVIGSLAGAHGVIRLVRLDKSKQIPTESLDAYDCVLRAHRYMNFFSAERHFQVRECLEQAIVIDRNYADAWAWLSFMYAEEYTRGFNPRPAANDSLERALETARHAVDLDPINHVAYWALAEVRFLRKEIEPFFLAAERALALNPNDPATLALLGHLMAYAGKWERGTALTKKAAVLNPNHPGWYHYMLVLDHYRRGAYREALAEINQVNIPNFYLTHMYLAAIYGQLGQMPDADAAVADLLNLYPNFAEEARETRRKFNFPEDVIEHLVDGLRKAGLDIPDEPAADD